MSTIVHFIDVGQGNMTLLQLADGNVFLYDCNVTADNEDDVLDYLSAQIGEGTEIDVFVCSHRDADHLRGVKRVHERFPIQHVWDTGVVGSTPSSPEYKDYMDLRRTVGYKEVDGGTRFDYGNSRLRVMNSANDDLPDDPNAQSIVIKVVHRDAAKGKSYDSVLLTGDTDAVTWKDLRDRYADGDLSCSLLLGSHHGSITFFDDPADDTYYTSHLKAMAPEMTIISVGNNSHGHPDSKALEFYGKYSSGADNGDNVYCTDEHGHMRVELKDGGGWSLRTNQ